MSFDLPHSPEAPGRARAQVAVHACHAHCQDALPAVQLAASELTTSALLYGTAPMTVTLTCEVSQLRLSVRHGVPVGLEVETLPVDDDGLRSALLDKLAREWGVRPSTEGGRELWCLTPTGHLPTQRRRTQVPGPRLQP